MPNRKLCSKQAVPKKFKDAPKALCNHKTLAAERFAWFMKGYVRGMSSSDFRHAKNVLLEALPKFGKADPEVLAANYHEIISKLNGEQQIEAIVLEKAA